MKCKYILLSCLLGALTPCERLLCQSFVWPHGGDTLNFFSLQEQMNNYFAGNPKASGYKPWKRYEWFMQRRVGAQGEIVNTLRNNGREFWNYLKSNPAERATHGSWVFLGPNEVTNIVPGIGGVGLGRLNTIKLHPTDPDIIYVGASSGGIWKSVNGGATWADISPHLPSLSIKDIVIYPNDPQKIFVLTGDVFNTGHNSIGILKSSNGGETWEPTNAPEFLYKTNKLMLHPTTPETQYAATSYGLYKTTDEWQSYTLDYTGGEVFDIEFKPGDPSVIYISTIYNFLKQVNSGPWMTLYDVDFPYPFGYSQIAVTPALPSCIYGLVSADEPKGLYRSLDSGASNTWTIQDTVMFNFGAQGAYNRSLEVHPENADLVTMGHVWTKVSDAGGLPGTWTGPSNYVHADVHNSLFHDDALFHANDGGLFKSTDGGITFTDLSSDLEITEIYGIGGTPQNDNLFFFGTQDNGTQRRIAGTSTDHVLAADGGNCLINYTNPDTVFAMYQEGWLHRSTDGGDNFSSINPPGNGAWVTPLIMDPVHPSIIFIGKDTLYRSSTSGNPGSWVNLGKPYSMGGSIIAMAQGTSNRQRIYVSNQRFADNKIFRADNAVSAAGTLTWTNISNGLPEGSITAIAVNPDNEQEVFICLANLQGGQKVYKSTAGGNPGTWVNISNNLPNVIYNCLEYHDNGLNNNAIYVGSDIGVFYRDDDLNNWIYFSNNMPVVIVNDLYINQSANTITAGTYGRGLWKSPVYSGCVANLVLSNPTGDPVGGIRVHSATNSIISTVDYRSDLLTEVQYTAANFIELKPGFQFGGFGNSMVKIGPCPGQNLPSGFQADRSFNFDFESWLSIHETD